MSDTDAILHETAHRPWPLPPEPWVMYQSWQRQLFMHWPVQTEMLRALVPDSLELDAYHGTLYVGITPFELRDFHVRMLPPLPGVSHFLETNLRTYVRVGGRAGVFFFSLDAASKLAVAGARLSFHLPYFEADMDLHAEGEWIRYSSKRIQSDAELVVRYRPTGRAAEAPAGTLDHFLVERYALYVVHGDRIIRGDIHHRPWRLQPAEAVIERNTLAQTHQVELPSTQPILHYSQRQDTLLWPPAVAR
jgi:uncharacterized protein YqjF (DUF2071 family)